MTSRPALIWLAAILATGAAPADEASPRFEHDVLPILRAHCLKCHGTSQRKGGLNLRTVAAMLEGGDNGPSLVRGNAEESPIIERVEAGDMPPGDAPKLSAAEAATLRAWVAAGAVADGSPPAPDPSDGGPAHWAFLPPRRPEVPPVADPGAARNAVDAFLLKPLGAAGLGFSAEADRRTLIRRATFDLWGLPPSPEEVDAFLADPAPDAYERLVDRLLESPRYGERWARHWLDLAGYADSEGILAADYVRSAAWRYRDWVIRAFNADLPYDRFLRDQIAGDEVSGYWEAYRTRKTLPPEVVAALTATGFLRCASDTSRPDFAKIKNAPGYYYQTLEDTVKIVATSTLGLTLQCAKCHTHKYDPITQAEYYRVQAVFMGGYRPAEWVPQAERKRAQATAAEEAEAAAHNAALDAAIAGRRKEIEAIAAGFADRHFAGRLAALPDPIRDDVRAAFAAPADQRDEVRRYLFAKFEADLRPPRKKLDELIARDAPADRDAIAALKKANTADDRMRVTFAEIRAFYDLPGEPKTPILQRGDYLQPGPEVRPGAPEALATPEPFRWDAPQGGSPTGGRRRAFAAWLTQPGHPLTARVMANRLWLHHFGEGIVATPDNFGVKGTPPTHPELLDWLATEFVARGWSVKAMHRLMMTSAAYRQSSRDDPGGRAHAADPDDLLLWRQRLRRLEAEALRDAVLRVAGTLVPANGGPPAPMVALPDGEIVAPDGPEGLRRSIYLQVRRSKPLTLLQVFDQPVMETNCTRRPASTVPLQALNLLNSGFMARQAEAFAARIAREAPDDPAGRAVLLAFGRPPGDGERVLFRAYLDEQAGPRGRTPAAALADVCQMLLSSNEFVYID